MSAPHHNPNADENREPHLNRCEILGFEWFVQTTPITVRVSGWLVTSKVSKAVLVVFARTTQEEEPNLGVR